MMNRDKYIANAQKALAEKNKAKVLTIYNSIRPLPRGYVVKNVDNWCATFVSAMMWLTSGGDATYPYECGCEQMVKLAQNKKIWIEDEAVTPKVGWSVLYDWQDNGKGNNTAWSDHIGIVEKVTSKQFTVIEGNYNNTFARRTVKIDGKYLRGFIALPFEDEVKPNTKSIHDIALEVISGKWSTGATRKQRLTDAGYDYAKVQAEVNKILRSL